MAGGWLTAECGVAAAVIVGVQPDGELVAAFIVAGVEPGVGSFVGQGSMESPHLAVGLWVIPEFGHPGLLSRLIIG